MPGSTSTFSLRTARLLLRPWQPDDAEAALAIYSEARVMRYLGSAGATRGARRRGAAPTSSATTTDEKEA